MTAATETAPAAVGLSRRVKPVAGVSHIFTLAKRNLLQIKHNPMELSDLTVQPIMFVLLFVFVFGPSLSPSGEWQGYLPLVIPGMIAQNAMFATMTTGVGINTDLTKGVFDRFRSLPIARMAPLAGRILADTVKQAWSVTILLLTGFILGYWPDNGILTVIPAFALLLAFALLFTWIAVLVGVTATEPEKVMVFGFTLIFPITFTSTAFVTTKNMPGWLEFWFRNNPVTHLVEATRGILDGGQVGGSVAHHTTIALLWGVGATLVFAPLALRALKRRV